jgi:hypothetical protein
VIMSQAPQHIPPYDKGPMADCQALCGGSRCDTSYHLSRLTASFVGLSYGRPMLQAPAGV